MKLELIYLIITLPLFVNGWFGGKEGIVLISKDEQNTESAVLGSNHKCTAFPQDFNVSQVKNTGSSHCGMWTQEDCEGTLYVVPAHYSIQYPDHITIKSLIC